MATTIGFKRATIFVYDDDDKVKDTFVVEGNSNEGGTVSASISGLSAESTKTYASNIPYFVSQQGTGEVELSLSVLDLPQEATNALLGYEESEDGIVWVGEDTRPPYAGIVMESNLLNGEPYFFSLLKGKFRLEEQTFETNEDQPQEPQPDELTGSFVAVDGITYGMAKGEDKRQAVLNKFNNLSDDSNAPGEETP